ncbi:hypothetical protein KMT30_39675, partial [Streptomyces sp. IBSBF 2953]|nr:hypothetical protein [Streptomyces hayashii]
GAPQPLAPDGAPAPAGTDPAGPEFQTRVAQVSCCDTPAGPADPAAPDSPAGPAGPVVATVVDALPASAAVSEVSAVSGVLGGAVEKVTGSSGN